MGQEHYATSALIRGGFMITVVGCAAIFASAAVASASPLNFGVSNWVSIGIGARGLGFSIPGTVSDGGIDMGDIVFDLDTGEFAMIEATSRFHGGRVSTFVRTTADVRDATGFSATASATVTGSTTFFDDILFESDTLPVGALISYTLEQQLVAELGMIAGSPICTAGSPVLGGGYARLYGLSGVTLTMSFCEPTGPLLSATTMYTGLVGDIFTLGGTVMAGSMALACFGGPGVLPARLPDPTRINGRW